MIGSNAKNGVEEGLFVARPLLGILEAKALAAVLRIILLLLPWGMAQESILGIGGVGTAGEDSVRPGTLAFRLNGWHRPGGQLHSCLPVLILTLHMRTHCEEVGEAAALLVPDCGLPAERLLRE